MKRTRPPHSQLLLQLARAAQRLGTCRIVMTTSPPSLEAMASAGAARSLLVIGYEGEAPYAIEKAELVIANLVIEARGSARPARPNEAAALASDQAFYYLGTYKAVEMPPGEPPDAPRDPSNKE